jgi:hypothetical protein
MFTRFIELVFGLCVALYLLIDRFGIAGCVRAMRRADPLLLLAVSGAVIFLWMALAAQTLARWRKERERKRKERQRSAERRRKAADHAAQPAAATDSATPAQPAAATPATLTTPDPATTLATPDDGNAGPRFLRRHAMPDLLDGLMPDSADGDDDADLVQVVVDAPVTAPAAGDDYVI